MILLDEKQFSWRKRCSDETNFTLNDSNYYQMIIYNLLRTNIFCGYYFWNIMLDGTRGKLTRPGKHFQISDYQGL